MKNEKAPKQEIQAELQEPQLERTEGGLIAGSPLLDKLADPRPSPHLDFELEL